MPDVPDWVYDPVSFRDQNSEGELSSDLELDNVPAGVQPGELTASGEIPKGQRIRKHAWIACFAVKGTATVWLNEGNCTVYRVLYDAFYETETWWLRAPPVLIERTSDWRSQWWRYLEVCADGSVSWLPGEEWLYGEHRMLDRPGSVSQPGTRAPVAPPPTFIPPDEILRSRSAHSMRDGGGEFLLFRDLLLKRVSAGQRSGCLLVVVYEVVIRVSRFALPNGPEVVVKVEHRDPPQFENVSFRIPGCVDETTAPTSEESAR